MKFILIFCLLAVALSMAQRQRVAVLPSIADPESKLNDKQLTLLTNKTQEYANENLPKEYFQVLQLDYARNRLGDERLYEACKEGTCIGDLVKEIDVDFGARCEVSTVSGKLYLTFELHGTLRNDRVAETISKFTREVKNFNAMLALIDKDVPKAFKKIIPQNESQSTDNLLTDTRDGKKYKIVKIGSQTWMAENLNYEASGSKCYDNKLENCVKYGRLYDWSTAIKVCPSEWHLPSDEEWQMLVDFAGGEDIAGARLKAKSEWFQKNNGTDEYRFTALPGGYGNSKGNFDDVGYYSSWWSSTKYDNNHILCWDFKFGDSNFSNSHYDKISLFSIRCVKD